MKDMSSTFLLESFRWTLAQDESDALDKAFMTTLKRCTAAKAFKIAAQRETKFKQAKRQLVALGHSDAFAKKMARKINMAGWVFKNLTKIYNNLALCKFVDIRRLAMKELYLAKNLDWCLMRDESIRERQARPPNTSRPYDENVFQHLLNIVKNSDCYQ